ncbi:TonB-dependent receptor plug domain-containing protein [Rhodoflexus sp.]
MKSTFTICLFKLLIVSQMQSFAQNDSLKMRELDELVITATRTEKMVSALPMPVTVISQKQIRQMGSLRLNEVLQEQTGLAIVTNHGQGLQVQGFNPEYTLILIDGEPLIGRTAGTLELSRIAVGNIKQIEIVKGPSSSLYGSEALAGVVNIITENPTANRAGFATRYGTNQTLDFTSNLQWKKERTSASLFANRYSTAGYDFTPQTFGQTVEPFHNYTVQAKAEHRFSDALRLSLSGRYFTEKQQSNFDMGSAQIPNPVSGEGSIKDLNLNPLLNFKASGNFTGRVGLYYSKYRADAASYYLSDGNLFETSFFNQTFLRPETQLIWLFSSKHNTTFGSGMVQESVEATRYTQRQQLHTIYAFAQHEWLPNDKWHIIAGGRFDCHSVYGSQFSPKLSAQYQLTPKLALRASGGVGFKAPDFRQLYLNFINNSAGYSVFGTEEVSRLIQELQAQGQIGELFFNPEVAGSLRAERSLAWNFGGKWNAAEQTVFNINFFRNDVQDLIESQVFARRANGQNIFSYRNLSRVFTQGIEIDGTRQLSDKISLAAGYQLLLTGDKSVIDKINNGEIFRRDPVTLITSRLNRSDYGGLFGRSRHMANAKIFYENKAKGWTANLRAIYRGSYGLGDRNGNLVLDDPSEYVNGFVTFNAALSKTFLSEKLKLQVGADNLLNFTNMQAIPNMPGRLLWTSLHFQIN